MIVDRNNVDCCCLTTKQAQTLALTCFPVTVHLGKHVPLPSVEVRHDRDILEQQQFRQKDN